MKKTLCLAALIALIVSCGGGKKQDGQKLVLKILSEKAIFIPDSVKAASEKVSKDHAKKAKILFFQGMDQAINKQNYPAGIKLYRESALYNPASKTYYYLANAYIDIADTANARLAINMASFLEYDQLDETAYTYARLAAISGDTVKALDQLKLAFENGFINKKLIEKDKCFEKIRNLMDFEAMMVSNFKDEVALKEKLFKAFLAEFPEAAFPLEIQKDSIPNVNTNLINYDFATFIIGMEDTAFSRDVTKEYLMVARFKTGKNIQAVIYKTITALVDTIQDAEILIATYDSIGAVLAELTIGEFAIPTTLTAGSIDTSGIITVQHFNMKWKNDPAQNGYIGNERLPDEFVNEFKFTIDEKGKFIPYSSENNK